MNQTLLPEQVPSNLSLAWRVIRKRCEQGLLPDMEIKVPGFRFNDAKRRRYNAYCGFSQDALPMSYIFVATQPIQLMILTDHRIPVQPLGMIHLGVDFEQVLPMSVDETYDVSMKVGNQSETEKGLEFELHAEFSQAGERYASYISRCLLRMPPAEGGRRRRRAGGRKPKVAHDWQVIAPLELSAASARTYARISGDFNPIHLHRITAKPFGFEEPIAHGMYMVAKMLASVKEPLKSASFDFKRTVNLPGSARIERDGNAMQLANEAGKALVEAQIQPL